MNDDSKFLFYDQCIKERKKIHLIRRYFFCFSYVHHPEILNKGIYKIWITLTECDSYYDYFIKLSD